MTPHPDRTGHPHSRPLTLFLAGLAGFVAFFVALVVVFAGLVEFAADLLVDDPTALPVGLVVGLGLAGAAAAAAVVAVLARRDEATATRTPVSLGLVALWPLVFGIGGILDGSAPGEPATTSHSRIEPAPADELPESVTIHLEAPVAVVSVTPIDVPDYVETAHHVLTGNAQRIEVWGGFVPAFGTGTYLVVSCDDQDLLDRLGATWAPGRPA